MSIPIPVYNTAETRIIGTTKYTEANLNIEDVPSYMNEGGCMQLRRTYYNIDTEQIEDNLILIYHYPEQRCNDKAIIISDEEAYRLCVERNKQELIRGLHINPRTIEE